MSLSLDGRLPSGRRSVLLRHIAQCPTCSATWEGMKAAQDTAIRLPTFDVGPEFGAALHHRIASGEGAPDAVYHDPVPHRAKVRYLLSGAAAAALLITGINLVVPRGESREPRVRSTDLAARATPDRSRAPAVAERPRAHAAPASASIPYVEPINEQTIARRCVDTLEESTKALRSQLRSLKERPIQDAWGELERVVTDLEISVRSLDALDSLKLVELPNAWKRQFREADILVQRVKSPNWEIRRKALEELQQLQLVHEGGNQLMISCCRPPDEMSHRLQVLVQQVPSICRIIPPVVWNQPAPQAVEIDNAPRGALILQFKGR